MGHVFPDAGLISAQLAEKPATANLLRVVVLLRLLNMASTIWTSAVRHIAE
ncbi:hypothetical protein ABIC07_008418 [Bradyrhizobium sp. RT9a]